MGKLYVTEYANLGDDFRTTVPAPKEPGADQTPVDFTSGAAQSADFATYTRFVRLQADTACHLLFGNDPTATTNAQPLAANVAEYRAVVPGQKLSVIAAS